MPASCGALVRPGRDATPAARLAPAGVREGVATPSSRQEGLVTFGPLRNAGARQELALCLCVSFFPQFSGQYFSALCMNTIFFVVTRN